MTTPKFVQPKEFEPCSRCGKKEWAFQGNVPPIEGPGVTRINGVTEKWSCPCGQTLTWGFSV